METITEKSCCQAMGDEDSSCCKVVAIVSVDSKGQMVLPKELREAAGITPGEKLAITTWERDGRVVALSLTKADQLAQVVKGLLGPLMTGTINRERKE